MISLVEWDKCMDFHAFSMIPSVEWEAWAAQCMDFQYFVMISSVEWEVWEAQNHRKCTDFYLYNFCDFFGRVGRAGSAESLKIIDFHTLSMTSLVEWEA